MTNRYPPAVLTAPAAALLCAGILAACSVFDARPSKEGDGPTVVRVPFSGDFEYEVDAGDSRRDVYFVFSASANGSPAASTVRSLVVDGDTLPAPSAPELPASYSGAYGANVSGAQRIADFNASSLARLGRAGPSRATGPVKSSTASSRTAADYVADVTTNRFANDGYVPFPRDATCRYVSPAPFVTVAVPDAVPRRLVIWVDDADWGVGAEIDVDMVNAMADRFLKPAGTNDDIYDWLTAILGAEWGSPASDWDSSLIRFSGDIHILLTDIEGDASPYGGIIGYFYSLNNFTNAALQFTQYAGMSNEKIMFVIDSYMFANRDTDGINNNGAIPGAWAPDGYWPEEVYSTLAHEFQHMIHFHQKGVVAGAGESAEVWIDEFCAQLAEDLLADKMKVQGPRGVDYTEGGSGSAGNKEGRIPLYNGNTYLPLEVTSGASFGLLDYSTVYAFASWAARNYGGSEFLRRVVQSSSTDRRAVESAAASGGASRSDLNSLIGRWAVSVMNSDRTDMPAGFRTNIGDWFPSSTGGKPYRLGSIDYFNYLPRNGSTGDYGTVGGPAYIEAGQAAVSQSAASNVFYAAARGLRGSKTFSVSLPSGVVMYLVLR